MSREEKTTVIIACDYCKNILDYEPEPMTKLMNGMGISFFVWGNHIFGEDICEDCKILFLKDILSYMEEHDTE